MNRNCFICSVKLCQKSDFWPLLCRFPLKNGYPYSFLFHAFDAGNSLIVKTLLNDVGKDEELTWIFRWTWLLELQGDLSFSLPCVWQPDLKPELWALIALVVFREVCFEMLKNMEFGNLVGLKDYRRGKLWDDLKRLTRSSVSPVPLLELVSMSTSLSVRFIVAANH